MKAVHDDHPSPAGATTIGEKMSVRRTEAPPLVGTLDVLPCGLERHGHGVRVAVLGLGDGAARPGGQAGEDPRHRSGDMRRNEEREGVGRAAVDQDGDGAVLLGGRSRHGLDHVEVATNRLERASPAERRDHVFQPAEWLIVCVHQAHRHHRPCRHGHGLPVPRDDRRDGSGAAVGGLGDGAHRAGRDAVEAVRHAARRSDPAPITKSGERAVPLQTT